MSHLDSWGIIAGLPFLASYAIHEGSPAKSLVFDTTGLDIDITERIQIHCTDGPMVAQGTSETLSGSTWRGITVAPENRCSPYDADAYRYSPSVEAKIVTRQGGIYGPYTGTWFASTKQTDIEHIVARSEAHDSGLCSASAATGKKFASDLLNLTPASPSVNRH